MGGDYDPLFLETSQASLSFIYQSLGCYHTLQPVQDPFRPPTVPALTPQGFVRWQTVQLLLQPEEHVPFLQAAVKRFDITNPIDGGPFPRILPKEALPCRPDIEMTEWHEKVSQTLMLEARISQARNAPPEPSTALSDVEPESSICSSIDDQSMVGAASSSTDSRPTSQPSNIHIPPRSVPPYSPHLYGPDEAPWSPEHRRNSLPPHVFQPRSPWVREGLTPTGSNTPTNLPRHRLRSPSTISTDSSSSCSSSPTTDSASPSPTRLRPPYSPVTEQRHHSSTSSSVPPTPHNYPSPQNPLPPHHHHHYNHTRPPPPPHHHPQTSYFPPQPSQPQQDLPRPNARGLNVRWNNFNSVFLLPGSAPATPSEEEIFTPRHDDEEEKASRTRERGQTVEGRREGGRRRGTSPLRGVRGRRYPAEGIAWR